MTDPGVPALDATGPRTARAPLRYGGFRAMVAGRALTSLVGAMAPIVLAFAVLDLTGSTTDLGVVVGARSIANVVVLLVGGVLADRLPRALILQGSTAAAALVQFLVALSVLLGFATVPLLVGLSLFNGAFAAVSLPASAALTPQTVPPGLVRQANALVRMGRNAGTVAGMSLGGLASATIGVGWALVCNAALFAVAAACYAGVRTTGPAPGGAAGAVPPSRPLRELADGWREFTARSWVWVVVLQFLVVNAAASGGVQVLGTAVANRTIGRSAWGLVLAMEMVGALAGGVLVARSRTRHALRVGVLMVAAEALPLVLLAGHPSTVLLAAGMFVNGMAVECFGVAWDVSLQENIPADRLARVYSYDALGSFMAMPLGEISAGPLAARFGTGPVLIGGAVLVAVATAAALLDGSLRRLTVDTAAVGAPAQPLAAEI